MLPLDTSDEAQRVQLEVYRRMGPSRCAELGLEMSEDSRELTRCGIRHRYSGYTEVEVEWALRRILFGDDQFAAAWPDAPLVEP